MSHSESPFPFHFLALAGLLAATAHLTLVAPNPANSQEAKPKLAQKYSKLPLSFEANQGQSDPRVRFQSRGQGYSLFLTDKAAVLALTKSQSAKGQSQKGDCHPERSEGSASTALLANRINPSCPTQTDTLTLELTHSKPTTPTGTDPLPGTANYFLGNDPAQWFTNVPTYSRVAYNDVYDGIDLVYYGNQRQLEYDFVVAPHADPNSIQLHFAGAQKLHLTPTGDLEVTAKNGKIAFHKPEIYQTIHGLRQPIQGSFTLAANQTIQFRIGKYDRTRPLVVDPILAYSTYLGGSTNDFLNAIAVGTTDNAYVTGTTFSADFPIKDPYQRPNKAASLMVSNAFITKFSPNGTVVLYSTYVGGSGRTSSYGPIGDSANGIAVDSSGNAYITGAACSTNFPVTKNAFQASNNGTGATGFQSACNAFLTMLSPSGTAILYSTYFGGSGSHNVEGSSGNFNVGDVGNGIAVDSQGNAYIVGTTESTDFPVTPGVVQQTNHAASLIDGSNAFIAKFYPPSGNLLYSTYLGGSGGTVGGTTQKSADSGHGIAVDVSGNAYVTGATYSRDFPVSQSPLQPVNLAAPNGASAAFVAKLNPSASALVYSTFLSGRGIPYSSSGESEGDSGSGIAVDAAGSAYIVGSAGSNDFPTTKNAFQKSNKSANGFNAFVSKLNSRGSGLLYSTYIGGSPSGDSPVLDYGSSIALDSAGDAYITGTAQSTNFPVTSDAYQETNSGTTNAFIVKLDLTGSRLLYSSYIGGNASDYGNGIGVNSLGDALVAGQTSSRNFPVTSGTYQTTNKALANNGSNAFVAKFTIGSENYTTVTNDPLVVPQGSTVTFTAKVVAPHGPTTPTGTITFGVYDTVVAVVPLVDGVATYSTSSLGLGDNSMEANYSGDAIYPHGTAYFSEQVSLAAPIISPAPGSIPASQPITITDQDLDSSISIHYTTGGSTPTASSNLYSGPFNLPASNKPITIKAIAVSIFDPSSPVTSATYTAGVQTPSPTISPATGNYLSAQQVTIADDPRAIRAPIYYTLDGSTPTTSSSLYTGPFLAAANETVQASAVATGDILSVPAQAMFKFVGWPVGISAPATSIKKSTAALNAFASTQGLAGTYYFQYGTSGTKLTLFTAKTAINSTQPVQVSIPLTGLVTKTTYYFQFVATTAAGTTYGPVLNFTTE